MFASLTENREHSDAYVCMVGLVSIIVKLFR